MNSKPFSFFSDRTSWDFSENPLSQLVSDFKRQDIAYTDLTISNPTSCGFRYLDIGILEAFNQAGNLIYSPTAKGLLQAREAICSYYLKHGIHLTPEQIFLTAGTSEAYSYLFKLLANPNEAILAPQPSYPLFDFLVQLNDVASIRYPLQASQLWGIDFKHLESAGKKQAKAILIVNPNNPTGSYVTEEEKRKLNTFASQFQKAIISDEVFFDFFISPTPLTPQSFASNTDVLTFTLSGISKILGLPQMKLAWIIVNGPKAQVREAVSRLEVISDTYLSVSTPAQHALPAWLSKLPEIQSEILQRLKNNLFYLTNLNLQSGKYSIHTPSGGWSAILETPKHEDDQCFAVSLLKERRVLVHPGYLFDFEENYFVVVSLLLEEQAFQAACLKLFAD